LDERTVGGMKGADKIALIVRLQSLFRGYLARKKIR